MSESHLLVTYHLIDGSQKRSFVPMGDARSFVLGGLGSLSPKCNDITLDHPELPLPSRLCLLSRHMKKDETNEMIWEVFDLVPKGEYGTARCFLEKKGHSPVRVGYEPLKVEKDDKIVIRFPHREAGSTLPVPVIELKTLHGGSEDNVTASSLGDTKTDDQRTKSGDSVNYPWLINDLQRENLLPEKIGRRLYEVFHLLRQQKNGEKVSFFKQDKREAALYEAFKNLDAIIAKTYGVSSAWLFENGDQGEHLRENVVHGIVPDLTSFFRFIMRLLQRYGLGDVRASINQWAGWKFGMPLYRNGEGEKKGVIQGGAGSGQKSGNVKNSTQPVKLWGKIVYERTNLKYWDKYPHDVLDRFGIIPLTASIHRDRIYWAVLDPFDLGWRVFLDALRQPNESEYLNMIDIVDYDRFMKDMGTRQNERRAPENEVSVDDGSQAVQYEAIPARMQKMLQDAQDQRASDIHIEADEDKSIVRFRVDGVLHNYADYSKETHNAIISHFKVRTQMDVTEKRRPQDGRLNLSGTDIRASTYPTVKGEKFVLRLLDQESIVTSTDRLGMLPFDLQLLRTNIHGPNGLILICGPTGSGKTTTLYACLSELNKTDSNIMTIEEPVEYRLHGINQMQVRTDIDLTFEKGLRTILRQDPDIIMVGEIRDQNTARTAIQAAMTGHLVLSTIHTNSAPQAVGRLLEMGVEPYMITSALNLTVSQRLVRRVCPSCRKLISGAEIRKKIEGDGFDYRRFTQTLGMEIPQNDHFYTADPNGCSQCFNRGYRGRMAIFETFNMSREVRDRIHANVTDSEDLWLAARGAKWREKTLWAHARHLLMRQGVTTFEEIIRIMGL
ncbi:MAG: type II/IV secretion system protein [Magnetococcales bacterium]|nr:type II/IV secretion system protein [Magnetococcales bacterium]